jgi:hypothetical protein
VTKSLILFSSTKGADVKKTVLFYRNYKFFSGGQMKVRDYFNHVEASGSCEARICIAPSSSPDNIWTDVTASTSIYRPEQADILFIAGMDWAALEPHPNIEERRTVINLIQSVQHALPRDPRHKYLARRAVRICVSREVAAAIGQTGKCIGPIYTIPNGLDFGLLPETPQKDTEVFIAGLKRPNLAEKIAAFLKEKGVEVDCATERIERGAFLKRMSRARVAVTLPLDQEGFFLPALEAMAMGCTLICPDCLGNRSFCVDNTTCLMPPPVSGAIGNSTLTILQDAALGYSLRAAAFDLSKRFDISHERNEFLAILSTL